MSNFTADAPLTVALIDDSELAQVGLRVMLQPYETRVRFVGDREAVAAPGTVDVVLYEPAATSPVLRSRLSSLADGGAGTSVAYSWAPPEDVETPEGVVCLPKTLTASQLVVALEEVVTHRHPGLVRPAPRPAPPPIAPGPDPVVASLTTREHQVLALIARGLPNRDIAAHLGLSLNSVKTYIRTAYRKVGVERRTQAVLWGLDHGFADDDAAGEPADPDGAVVAPAG